MIAVTVGASVSAIWGGESPAAVPRPVSSVIAWNTQTIRQITESWRPYRAWVALLLRAWREAETGEIARGRRSTTCLQPPNTT